MVRLAHAVAVAMHRGPDAGLALLGGLDDPEQLRGHHLLAATRADLHRRAGRFAMAGAAYDEALLSVRTEPERRYLLRRKNEVRT